MDKIIADKYYTNTKNLIQAHVGKDYIDDKHKDMLVILYNQLTLDNAEFTHNCVVKMHDDVVMENRQKSKKWITKLAFIWILIGGVLGIPASVCKNYTMIGSNMHYLLTNTQYAGFHISLYGGLIMFFNHFLI